MWTPPPQSDRRRAVPLVASETPARRLPSMFELASGYHNTPSPPAAAAAPSRMTVTARDGRPVRSTTRPSPVPNTTRRLTLPATGATAATALAREGGGASEYPKEADGSIPIVVAAAKGRPRPLTNSERGRQFRLREKAHEQTLMQQLKQLRLQIAQLESSEHLAKQRTFMTRTGRGGSLEKITRELYSVFRFGLESQARATSAGHRERSSLSAARSKESFLRSVVDQNVVYGDLFGVEALIGQWRKHTAAYSKFEIEIDYVEPIAGSQTNPIVVIHTKLIARFSRETLSTMFPSVLERRPDLASRFINRDITFHCVSRFTFSETDRITTYLVDVNFVEALVKTVGSVRDVANLMEFSVVTPLMTFREVGPEPPRYVSTEQYGEDDHGGRTNQLHRSRLETRSYPRMVESASMQRDDWHGQGPECHQQRYQHPYTCNDVGVRQEDPSEFIFRL